MLIIFSLAMKILLVIGDGMGDRPSNLLGGRTPLQYAKLKFINSIVKESMVGLMDPIAPGIRPGSDTSHLAILGYDPYEVYTGRGPFEAAGLGMELQPGDIAFRCNFSTVDENMVVIDRRAGRIKEAVEELVKDINGIEIDGVKFFVKAGVEHRAALVMRGNNLSPYVSDADPHKVGAKIKEVLPLKEEAKFTATVINKFIREVHKILSTHEVNRERIAKGLPPANILLPRGAGIVPNLRPIESIYGIRSACVVGIPLVKGICRLAGIHCDEFKGATGSYNTDYVGKIKRALDLLKDGYDFVLVNYKATDLAGHDGDPLKKVEVLEKIDSALSQIEGEDILFVFTADHTTPCTFKDHTGDPVPILIYGQDLRRDEVCKFDEVSVSRGSLRIRGKDLMNVILNYAGIAEMFGA